MKEKKLVHGVGVNDADYVVQIKETVGYKDNGKPIQKRVWSCPFYITWSNMFNRCYSEKYQESQLTYIRCSVVPEWQHFMAFRSWMEKQDWKGKQLDKDILFPNNEIYSSETCCFVDANVNTFLTERKASRGEWPIGVNFRKDFGKFQARCRDVKTGKVKHLGYYSSPEEAHQAWLTCKLEQAKILASQQTDPRVAAALIDRYENYHKYFGDI